MKIPYSAVFLLAFAILQCGCDTVNMTERADPIARAAMVNDRRIVTDSALDDYAYIAGVNESRVGGILRIQIEIVNSSSARRPVNYRFNWFDSTGTLVESPLYNWETLIIEGGETKHIVGVAPNADVVDFNFKLLSCNYND